MISIKNLCGFLMGFGLSVASAQDFMGDFLAPPGPAKTTLRLISTDSFENKSSSDNTPTSEQRVLLYIPFYEKEKTTYGFNAKWDHLRIASDQTLVSGAKVPTHLYDVMFGGTYKRELSEAENIAVNLSFGSASDDPFASGGSSTLSSTLTYTKTQTPISRWMFFLNYSNNRSFANNIPLPGMAYVYTPSKDFIGVFGLPFFYVRKAFTEEFALSFFNLLTAFKAEASYKINGPVQVYASIGRATQSFYREDRTRDDDRLFYTEQRNLLGFKSPMSSNVFVDVYAGTVSNRSLFENKDFKLKPDGVISFDSRYLLGLTLSGRF